MHGIASGTKRPMVVELTGPAGAGKTTLAQALAQRPAPSIQRRRHMPWLARSTLGLLPAFFALYRTRGLWLPLESKELICLDALHQLVVRESTKDTKLLILDQGPVYTLTYLRLRGTSLSRWLLHGLVEKLLCQMGEHAPRHCLARCAGWGARPPDSFPREASRSEGFFGSSHPAVSA